jgi:NAD(P)-dependent dehydrogenase (short-subunit alcohol dehydrogenase family)
MVEDGADVMIMGRTEKTLTDARDAILKQVPKGRIEICTGDACKEADVKAALKKAHAMNGRLDILIPTVGGGEFKPLMLMDAEVMKNEFALNVLSVFYMVRYGVPLMQPGGSIVCLSSSVVRGPNTGLSAYVTAKAGLEQFVRTAAEELGSAQIRINAIRPGLTKSFATAGMFESDALIEKFNKQIPFGRTGTMDEVGRVVRYLAGPEFYWVTGQTFSVDGGQDLRGMPSMSDEFDFMFGKDVMAGVRAGKPPV